jgi:hypothetical protein
MAELRRSALALRRDAGWLVVIGASGLAVRLAFAWQYTHQPLGQYPWVDESSYWTWAQAILRGGWWPVRPFYQDPLYPYWLACLMGVVGSDVSGLRVASAGLGALTPLVVTWAGRTGLGRTEGLLAGWTTALYGPLIFADGSLEKEGLATFWTALALGLTAHLSRCSRPALAGAAGAAWGVVGLLRSNALLIAPLAAAWLVLGGSQPTGRDRRRGLRLALSYLAGFFLVLTPVASVNTAVSNPREVLGTTWQLGPNFYIGNGPEATGTYVAPRFVRAHPAYEAADYAVEAMRRAGRPLSPGQVSRFWLREGLRRWAGAPLASIRLLFRKLTLLTHRSEIPDNQDIEFVRIVAAPALGWGLVGFGIVFPLAVVGLARGPRTGFWWFLSLATGLGLAATALFFVVGRYRVPWVPGLALLAAAGVVDLIHRARVGDWRGLAWRLGVLGMPAALVSWRPQADPVPTRWGNQLLAMALADLRAGQIDPAIDALDLARASGPEMAEKVRRHCEHGPFHDLLRESIDGELGRKPNPASETRARIHQARWLRQLRESRAPARSLLEAALRAIPADAMANRELGALLLSWPEGAGDSDRALNALGRASSGPGGDSRATLLLALATSDRELLERSAVVADRNRDDFTTLVRAMLASRARVTGGGRGGPGHRLTSP